MKSYIFILLILVRDTLTVVMQMNETELESMFVEHFGDNSTTTEFKGWEPMRTWYLEPGEPKLKQLCKSAHKRAGKGSISINVLVMRPRFILFENYHYQRVDIIAYGIGDPAAKNPDMLYWHTPEGPHWYITQGLNDSCVFYATIPNITMEVFKLVEYVCGVNMPKD